MKNIVTKIKNRLNHYEDLDNIKESINSQYKNKPVIYVEDRRRTISYCGMFKRIEFFYRKRISYGGNPCRVFIDDKSFLFEPYDDDIITLATVENINIGKLFISV